MANERQWGVGERQLLEVLDRVVAAMDRSAFLGDLGGTASASHGWPWWTHDIDLFVRASTLETSLRPSATKDSAPRRLAR